MAKRIPRDDSSDAALLKPGDIETEMGVPIPGVILPQEQWAMNTAIHRLPAEPFDFEKLFGRSAPVVLDIGCGNGRFVVSSAVRRPDWDHIGIDILPVVIRYATRRAKQRGLSNARFAVCGGYEFLLRNVLPNTLQEIHFYHPQPYHDPGEKELRLIRPDLMSLIYLSLVSDGKIFLQTDCEPYWKYASEVFQHLFDWQVQEGPWSDDPAGRSRRELIAKEKGLPIFRGWGQRKQGITEEMLNSVLTSLPKPQFTTRPRRTRKR